MLSRCSSAVALGRVSLEGWSAVYDKPSRDGSSKLNIIPDAGQTVLGVVYDVDEEERSDLDRAEHLYEPLEVTVRTVSGRSVQALTYRWVGPAHGGPPYDWYVAMAQAGAAHHGLPASYYSNHLGVQSAADPIAAGIEPVSGDDLARMQDVLSEAVAAQGTRYSIHPGDLAWWIHRADPRHADQISYWMQEDDAVLMVDAGKSEMAAFARPGVSPIPLIDWGQRRLEGRGTLGWVSDDDSELVDHLHSDGYEPVDVDHRYEWDLVYKPIPEPSVEGGWILRAVQGKHEVDARRRAAHAAFQSTMDPKVNLDRYSRFARSPVYEVDRDLVAVAPDGTIAAFMIWWPDRSGVAQIEPFGTHPDYQRLGVGRALIHFALHEMRKAGMSVARVMTRERKDSKSFYSGVGFDHVGTLRWWQRG
jgi:GNAT superfamily N-acetyltransferase